MERALYTDLLSWKNASHRKPLILQGARQVGKTWLLREFGRREFGKVIYLNFESSTRLQTIFVSDFDIHRILSVIEIEVGQTVTPTDTLLIFDEIQEAENGLTVLKYFNENAPEYFVVAASSLLGVSLQAGQAFPAGKVDILQLYPLSFYEFLNALGENLLVEKLQKNNWQVLESFHEKLVSWLRIYYFVGGMPEAVGHYAATGNLLEIRTIQQNILTGYQNDFAKYAPIDIVPKIRLVWENILAQLGKENRKFIYGQLKKGSRAKDFEQAIEWLIEAGIVLKVPVLTKPAIPLKAYKEMDIFKLFALDVGLLTASAELAPTILLEKNAIMVEFKGALTEQYVAQQLQIKHDLYYWSAANATAEVDFVLQLNNKILPIEVKAEENLKAKSLRVFVEKFDMENAIRLSMSFFRQDGWLTNIPLYAAGNIYEKE